MNTHDIDIELPQGYAERPFDYSGDLYTEGQMRAAIKADRQRRGKPVAWIRKNGLRFISEIEPQDDSEVPLYAAPQPAEPDEERLAMEAVMESVDPATWPGLTLAQRCALGRFAKPKPAEPVKE